MKIDTLSGHITCQRKEKEETVLHIKAEEMSKEIVVGVVADISKSKGTYRDGTTVGRGKPTLPKILFLGAEIRMKNSLKPSYRVFGFGVR